MTLSRGKQKIVLPIVTLIAVLVLWEAASRIFSIPVYLMPSPLAIAGGAHDLGIDLVKNSGATLLTILLGFTLACVIGIPLGIAISVNRFVSDAIYPLIVFTHAIPIIAIAPVIVVSLGPTLAARLVIVVLITFFPIMVTTASGILDTPAEMRELARTTGASTLQEIRSVRLPHAVTFIFGGLRIGISVAVVGAVVSEFVSSDRGLGYLVITATTHFDIAMAMAAVITLALISVVLYQLIGLVHRLLFPWSLKGGNH